MSEETVESSEISLEEASLDPRQVEQTLERIRSEQNLLSGILGGAAGAIIGAALWAVVTVVTGYQIGFMAVGVGFLAGLGVRRFGKGIDPSFGYAGAGLALLGCALGNLLAMCGLIANKFNVTFFNVLSGLSVESIGNLMVATFEPFDLIFYAIAVYEGYKFSFRQITMEELGLTEE